MCLSWITQARTDPPRYPRSWLRRVTLNRAIDLLRARRDASSDVGQSPATCVFDSQTTLIVDEMVKTLGWYDQGGGLSQRIVDLLAQLAPGGGA